MVGVLNSKKSGRREELRALPQLADILLRVEALFN